MLIKLAFSSTLSLVFEALASFEHCCAVQLFLARNPIKKLGGDSDLFIHPNKRFCFG